MRNGLRDHGYDEDETTKDIFDIMTLDDFYKTVSLHNLEGVQADVYTVDYDDAEWYVKFFINYDDEVSVEIWSIHWWPI